MRNRYGMTLATALVAACSGAWAITGRDAPDPVVSHWSRAFDLAPYRYSQKPNTLSQKKRRQRAKWRLK